MMVITLTDCPPSLRGDLTKWLQEIAAGVYVGQVSARVREELWSRVTESAKAGRATMVYSSNNEQHLDFRIHNSIWEPIDFDGLKLILRPSPSRIKKLNELRSGFSNAARIQKARKVSQQKVNCEHFPESYIVLDVETTGLSAVGHELLEIGAIVVEKGEIRATYQAFIKPKISLSPQIKALTGLSDEMLQREGMELKQAISEFLEFAGQYTVVAHNASFDYSFLRAACQTCGLPAFSNRYIDTLTVARRLINDAENYKLSTLARYFGLKVDNAHRSIDDCLIIKQIYEKLIELMKNEGKQ